MLRGNILITSISSKIPLIKALRNAKDKFSKDIKIYGADINENIIGKYFVDFFWKMPKISDIKINEIIKYSKENNIGYIIPTRDNDVLFFAKYKKILLQEKINVFVSSYESVLFCFDKLNFYKKAPNPFLIPTYDNLDDIKINSNLVVKERYGAGSKKIAIDVSKTDAKEFAHKLQSPIYQPFYEGREYSVDSYLDTNEKCVSSIIRSRDLIIGGEAKVTTRVKNSILCENVKSFLEKNKILGHSVVQVIKKANKYYCIECNARFGGASTLSIKHGLDSFYWFLQECDGIKIKPCITDKIYKQIRISEDIYIES